MENSKTHNRRKTGFIIGVLILFVVILSGSLFYATVIKDRVDPLLRLKGVLENITQQEVIQNGHSLELRTSEIQELSTIERDMQSIIKYEATFLGTKKTLILRGNFKAKAGFDLKKAAQFSIEDGRVTGQLPKAEILSVEMMDFEIYHAQDGALNKLNEKDRQAATNQLLEQARKDAFESDLTERATKNFQQRLDDLMKMP